MLSLDLRTLSSRQEADDLLAASLDRPLLRQYLLQNLVREEEAWRWSVNLRVLDTSLRTLLDFPSVEAGRQYQGETLFLYGGESDYVTDEAAPRIRELFPLHRLRAIPGAGHWVYSDQPEAFAAALLSFLP
jgi:pimeloyl-ACP methyl ester carboxylesterase